MKYQGYKKYLSRMICLLLLGLITACTDVVCIEPDDFGYGYASILSNPGTPMIHSPQRQAYQKPSNFVAEYADWTDTGYVTDGSAIVLVVENNWNNVSNGKYNPTNPANPNLGKCTDALLFSTSSWVAWFGLASLTPSGNFTFDLCTPQADWCQVVQGSTVAAIPCVFTQGVGGYALLMPVDNNGVAYPNPNTTNGQVDSSWNLYHLGSIAPGGVSIKCPNKNDNSTLYDASCQAGGLYLPVSDLPANCSPSSTNPNIVGCKLYVKMLDQLYEDNAGSYTLAMKSGFISRPGVLSGLVDLVKGTLSQSTAAIYTALIPYLGYIRIVLILYIIFTGIGFLIGNVEITQRDFIIRILKVGLVIQVATTDTSWSFFNGYFFQFFTSGVDEITGMLAIGGNEDGFAKLDQIVNEFLSGQTLRKVTALLFTSISGFLFFFMFYFVAMIAIYAAVKAVVMYIICYTIISVLIITAPIFIPFILFKQTKHFFDEWLTHLISYFIQPIVILAFAFFVCEFVLNEMYYILGIRVCWTFIAPIFLGWDLYLWMPAPIASNSSTQISPVNCISTPGRICGNTSSSPGCVAAGDPSTTNIYNCTAPGYEMCGPYTCNAMRNPDVPYLDPNYANDVSKFQELVSGVYVDYVDLAVFAVLGWLMLKLIDVVPEIAKALAGTPFAMTHAAEAGNAIMSNAWSASKKLANYGVTQAARVGNAGVAAYSARKGGVMAALGSGISAAYNTKDIDIAKNVNQRISAVAEGFQDTVGGGIEYIKEHPTTKKITSGIMSVTRDAGLNTALLAGRLGIRAAIQLPSLLSSSEAARNFTRRANDTATYFMGKYSFSWKGPKFEQPTDFVNALRSVGSKAAGKEINNKSWLSPARHLFSMPVVSGLMNSLADAMDADKKSIEKRENVLENYQDKVGGLLDNFFESKFAKYSHAAYSLTGGAFGTDANKKIEGTGEGEDGMSRADYIRVQHEKNLANWQSGLMGDPADYSWTVARVAAQAGNYVTKPAANYLLNQATNQSLNEVPFLNRASKAVGLKEIDDDHPINRRRD